MFVHSMRPILSVPILAALALGLVCDGRLLGAGADKLSKVTDKESPAGKTAGDPAGAAAPGPLILDELPEPLNPRQPRTAAEQDRIEALSLFAAGRMLQQQKKYAEALRLYQRALRRDPHSATVARAIVPLAYRLKRHAEAVRYALKAVELEDADPQLVEELGNYKTDRKDFAGAARLYEKALAGRQGEKETADDIKLRMKMGRVCYQVDEYEKAADNFARVLHALEHPKQFKVTDKLKEALLVEPAATYTVFGECFLEAGRLDEAVAAYKKAHAAEPNKGRLHFSLAKVEQRRGNSEKALKNLQICFDEKVADEGTAPYELLAEVLEATGRSGKLLPRLEKLHADDADNVPLGYTLAGQYLKAEQLDKAEQLYRTLVEKAPTVTGYRRLTEIYRKTRRGAALLPVLRDVVEKTGMLETLGDEAQAVAEDAELLQAVVDAARRKRKAEGDQLDFDTSLAVAMLALEAKQFETAAEFCNAAVKADAERAGEIYLIWGMALMLEDRAAEAVKLFQQAIDEKVLPDDNPTFYFYLAGALAVDERYDEALAAARKAAEIQDDSPRYQRRVCWVFYYAKRYDEAIEAYRELLEKFDADYKSPGTREIMRDARLVLSNLYVLQDDMEQAEEWLEQVLDEFPDDVGASNDLGYLWADQGKYLHRAEKMIRYAIDAEPENAAYRDSLGWVYFRLGRHKEAVAELEKAAELEEDPDAVILDHLGDAYRKTNRPQKAKDAWHRAVETFRKQEEPDEAKQVEKKIKALGS